MRPEQGEGNRLSIAPIAGAAAQLSSSLLADTDRPSSADFQRDILPGDASPSGATRSTLSSNDVEVTVNNPLSGAAGEAGASFSVMAGSSAPAPPVASPVVPLAGVAFTAQPSTVRRAY
jgi:hypothetical protein